MRIFLIQLIPREKLWGNDSILHQPELQPSLHIFRQCLQVCFYLHTAFISVILTFKVYTNRCRPSKLIIHTTCPSILGEHSSPTIDNGFRHVRYGPMLIIGIARICAQACKARHALE